MTTSSPSRTGCVNAIRRPATKFPSVRCEADDDAEHGRGSKQPAGHRSYLWNHEQGREQPDEDDRRRHAATHDAIAGDRLRRKVAARYAAIDQACHEDGGEHDHADDDQSVPERHGPLFDGSLAVLCESRPAEPRNVATEASGPVDMADDNCRAAIGELSEDALARRSGQDGIMVADVDEIRIRKLQLVHDDVPEHGELAPL